MSKVLSLDKLSCPQIWNIEQEKDREKEKVGDRPAKLNEKKGNRELEREIKKQRRNPSGHQCKVKMSGSEKRLNENTLLSLLRSFFR